MMTNLDLMNQPKTSEQETTKIQRRAWIGGAMGALLASGRLLAQDQQGPVNNPFILLLKGIYQPAHLPNLGLEGVNLNDTSYTKTKIYPVFGVPGGEDQGNAIGTFYASFTNPVCVYDLPGGAIAMSFASGPVYKDVGFNFFVPVSDNKGGLYLEGTFELTVVDATGIYKPFKGGHNHMVDKLHQLANGSFDEFCFCNISQYQFP